MLIRNEVMRKLNGFKEYFQAPVSKKMRYLEELAMSHFHKYAIRNTQGMGEYEYRKWMKEDEAFADAVYSIRQQFIDECEYLMLCRAGYYGPDQQKKFVHIHTPSMSDFVKVARGYGIFRKYSNYGGAGKAGPADKVSDGGKGEAGSGGSEGGERGVCSVSETNPLP